nr:RNA-directed DNA polymerase, eukaryota, reverse transcriptase zinc-binding domain protein [Tanacetum cinerariifolium]
DDVLISFGFGSKWRSWIRGSLSSGNAFILVNGSPTPEFHFHRGLKQGDPLAPFLFLLIMESLHLSFSRVVKAGIFTGFRVDHSITLSHLFHADDAVFIGEWSHSNLKGIMNILRCFSLLSGDNMSSKKAWDETISKMKKRLSRWKLNTLSVGGRITLLKSVLGSTPIYNMSIFKSKVLASKKYEGLGVSSFYALNRALLLKWVWRYLSHDNSLWSRVISAMHGLNGQVLSTAFNSTWSSIINEVNSLKDKGVDLISHCTCISFWNDLWIGDSLVKLYFPGLYALEEKKHIYVADKMRTSISFSFHCPVRGGVESQQHDHLSVLLDSVILSNMEDI